MADLSILKVPAPNGTDLELTIKDRTARGLLNGHSVGKDVPSDAVFTDTTYESKAAVSGGTDVSLVTTGEKYIWNNGSTIKQDGITGATVNRYGICDTAAGIAAKTASIKDGTFALESGATVRVKFANSNSATNPTLNVNGTGAKAIMRYGALAASTGSNASWYAGEIVTLVYDGTNWLMADYAQRGNDSYIPSIFCSSLGNVAAKTASCTNYVLTANSWAHALISFDNTNAGALTLNVNNSGAVPIYINGSPSSEENYTLPAGTYLVFYDGTAYQFRTDGKLPGSITGDAATVGGFTVGKSVPSDAVFTDTTYSVVTSSANGLMSSTDKGNLDTLAGIGFTLIGTV